MAEIFLSANKSKGGIMRLPKQSKPVVRGINTPTVTTGENGVQPTAFVCNLCDLLPFPASTACRVACKIVV